MATAKIGSGRRFAALEGHLARRGAKNPAALAAYIGRRKYGAKRFAELAQAGRRRNEAAGDAAPPPRRTRV
jgi:hypothetical protein